MVIEQGNKQTGRVINRIFVSNFNCIVDINIMNNKIRLSVITQTDIDFVFAADPSSKIAHLIKQIEQVYQSIAGTSKCVNKGIIKRGHYYVPLNQLVSDIFDDRDEIVCEMVDSHDLPKPKKERKDEKIKQKQQKQKDDSPRKKQQKNHKHKEGAKELSTKVQQALKNFNSDVLKSKGNKNKGQKKADSQPKKQKPKVIIKDSDSE